MNHWDFTIWLRKDEVVSQYLTIPKSTMRKGRLLTKLNNGQMVSVTLQSLDISQFYKMDLKRAVWDSYALMLVPSTDRVNEDSGSRVFRDFNLGKSGEQFYFDAGVMQTTLLRMLLELLSKKSLL
ncbi:hypothetical protein TIFTF001_042775 [Ficus carica]|uniref:Uncharacterized protein n=1 Tax=Ficus carica TaxID=3494 RepID=A0AA88CGW4_FICCA|nr:hypothetical protein TIFTF001_042775 [Ficus carica]